MIEQPNPSADAAMPAAGPGEKRPTRFVWGLALGIGMGAVAVVAIAAVAYVVMVSQLTRRADSRRPTGAVTIKGVEAGKAWFVVGPDGHGTLSGYSLQSSSGGVGAFGNPPGTFASMDLLAPGSYNGVVVTHSVPVYVSKDTKLSIDGKPWSPSFKTDQTPAEALFSPGHLGDQPFAGRRLTVKFHKVGTQLVADSIDGSAHVNEGPLPWDR